MKIEPETAAPVVLSGFALGFIVLCLTVYLFKIAQDIVVPFIVALFIWYLINAIARALERVSFEHKKIPKTGRFALAILSLSGIMWFVYRLVSQNVAEVLKEAPKYQKTFEKILPQAMEMLGLDHIPSMPEILQHVDIGVVMTALAASFTGLAGKTLMVLFYVGFLLYEQRFFDKKIIRMIRDKEAESRVRHILHRIDVKIQGYISVKALVSAVDSLLTFAILKTLNVNFAEFWGLMAFFLHFIPYAGSFVAISMPCLIALIQFNELSSALTVMISLCVSHAFIGHILDPYLMGNNLNLSPIFIVSSLAMWGMIWGVPGMFLAIPILASIVITLSQFQKTRPLAILMSKTGVLEKR